MWFNKKETFHIREMLVIIQLRICLPHLYPKYKKIKIHKTVL